VTGLDVHHSATALSIEELHSMLTRGAIAPDFRLAATGTRSPLARREFAGRRLILIFLPASLPDELAAGLVKYTETQSQFADQVADLLAVSPATVTQLSSLASQHGAGFPLLSDPAGATAAAYDVRAADGQTQAAIYILDEAGAVSMGFEPERYPNLPAPAAVLRALRRLNDAPRPAPPAADDWRRGPAAARVTLIEYSDYQCQHCRALHSLLARLEEIYGAQIAVIHRHLPLRHTHPLAQLAAEAAEAAGAQGRFWAMHDRLFAAGDDLTRDHLIAYAAELGLDVARFTADLDNHLHEPAVNEDFKRAVAGGIKLPPTLFVNGILFDGARTEPGLRERLDALLGR